MSKSCRSSPREGCERSTEHHATTARRDEDKVLWKERRSLWPTRCTRDALPSLDDLAFKELCAGSPRLTAAKDPSQLTSMTGADPESLTLVLPLRSRARDSGRRGTKHRLALVVMMTLRDCG